MVTGYLHYKGSFLNSYVSSEISCQYSFKGKWRGFWTKKVGPHKYTLDSSYKISIFAVLTIEVTQYAHKVARCSAFGGCGMPRERRLESKTSWKYVARGLSSGASTCVWARRGSGATWFLFSTFIYVRFLWPHRNPQWDLTMLGYHARMYYSVWYKSSCGCV